MYKVKDYWNNRVNTHRYPTANASFCCMLADFLHNELKDCYKVLDYGVGIGRCFPAYTHCEEVVGLDITENYAEQVKEDALRHRFKFRHVVLPSETPNTPFADKEFDAVVSVAVLLHQPPADVVGVMREMKRIAKKVCVASFYMPYTVPLAEHCFNHDYPEICRKEGWEIQSIQEGNQIYFVY